MNLSVLKENIAGIDIYILDQILKDNYESSATILDAGCGNGRNLKWFYNNQFEIHGTDIDPHKIDYCKKVYPLQKDHFIVATAEEMPYETAYFDHIICNAVLHFAENTAQFFKMFQELVRILKPQGTLLIRMASNFGIASKIIPIKDGVYRNPDLSTRFLLTQTILDDLLENKAISLIEGVKTTIVHDKRSMTTIVLKKQY